MLKLCTPTLRCIVMGVIIAMAGCVLTNQWSTIYKLILKKAVELKPGNFNFEMWRKPPVPIYVDFYFFNWTNPEDLEVEGKKPHFVEVGPYRFRETRDKKDVVWNPNYTVSFKQERVWYFEEEMSVGPLSDQVTTLNVVALSSAYVSRNWNYFTLFPLNTILRSQPLFITHNVSEILFEGFSDTIIKMAMLSSIFSPSNAPPMDKFAWFYKRNGSEDYEGVYNMRTGEDDIQHVARLVQWDYKNSTGHYAGNCGDVGGFMGERLPPSLTKSEPISLYSREICRSLPLVFSRSMQVEGIHGYRYEGSPLMFDNGTLNSKNKCFCGGSTCTPSGVLNISSCQFGSPSFISLPHFHLADPYFLNSVSGLAPDADKHNAYAVIEPTTGLPLDVAGRLQINILVQPYKKLGVYQNLPTVFFPMMWFEEHATITPKFALYVKVLLLLSPMGYLLACMLAIAGTVLATTASIKYYHIYKKTHRTFVTSGVMGIQLTAQPRALQVYSTTVMQEGDEDASSKLLSS